MSSVGASTNVNCTDKITVCFRCKTIRYSKRASQECSDCNNPTKGAWENTSHFLAFVKTTKLKGYIIDNVVKEILTRHGLVIRKKNQ